LILSFLRHDSRDAQLGCIYLHGSNVSHTYWNLLGMGIRLAQDAGVHKRKAYNKMPTPDEELYKRCFW
jgi:hypothetical protein